MVISPAKLKDDGGAELIIMVMLKETMSTSPSVRV